MNRGVVILALGLLAGIGTNQVYYRLRRPAPADTLDGQLAWMKSELRLSDGQFERIRRLHELTNPRLQTLAVEVAHLRAEFAAFEAARRTTDSVDFIAFARFVARRRQIDQECRDLTRRLVLAAGDDMTPAQRERYYQIVDSAGPRNASAD